MDDALVTARTLARLLSWPVTVSIATLKLLLSPVLRLLLFLLSPIYILASFLLLPLVHLVCGLYHILTFPLQLKWLERIETLYIYLGTAALVGSLAGAVLHFIFTFLSASLIDTPNTILPPQPRTAADFRAAQHAKNHALPSGPLSRRSLGRRARNLLSQVIVEEDDSDF